MLRKFPARSQKGSILIISLGGAVILTLLGTWLFCSYQTLLIQQERAQHAVQAAALAAACDLSNIVVEDSHWGFVSLSDHPACGKATLAPDNEALPVSSYNTILSTVRTEKLIADRAKIETLEELAEEDYAYYKQTKNALQSALEDAVLPDCKLKPEDMDGNPVNLYQNALRSLTQNLPELKSKKTKIKNFSISLGWLEEGSGTLTLNAERSSMPGKPAKDQYPSFTALSIKDSHFYFAGLSEQARLVDASRFRQSDGKRFSSCVMVKAELEITDGNDNKIIIPACAAALPYSKVNYCAAGTMAVYLPQGASHNTNSLRALISNAELQKAQVYHTTAVGDFPSDCNSFLKTGPSHSASCSIGRAFFDWLRTSQSRTNLNSIISALDHPFQNNLASATNHLMVAYSISETGEIQTNTITDAGFQRKTVADGQSYDRAANLLVCEKGALSVDIRNHVANPGIAPLKKHGGQPLFSELPAEFKEFTKESALAKSQEHKGELRISYYKGGLAAAIEINFSAIRG